MIKVKAQQYVVGEGDMEEGERVLISREGAEACTCMRNLSLLDCGSLNVLQSVCSKPDLQSRKFLDCIKTIRRIYSRGLPRRPMFKHCSCFFFFFLHGLEEALAWHQLMEITLFYFWRYPSSIQALLVVISALVEGTSFLSALPSIDPLS